MKLVGFLLAATAAFYATSFTVVNSVYAQPKKATSIGYSFEMLSVPNGLGDPMDVNNKGELAAERFDPALQSTVGVLIDDKGMVEFKCDQLAASVEAINNRGDITGACGDGAGYIRERNGKLLKFKVPGAQSTEPLALSDHGHVVGQYINPRLPTDASGFSGLKSFLYKDGVTSEIAAPPFADDVGFPHSLTWTMALGVNNRGQIIGFSQTIFTPSNEGGQLGYFILDNGQYTYLPDTRWLVKIDNDGRILAQKNEPGFFLWDDGRFFKLDPPAGYLWSGLWSLNDKGQVLGRIREDKPLPPGPFPPVSHLMIATPATPTRQSSPGHPPITH